MTEVGLIMIIEFGLAFVVLFALISIDMWLRFNDRKKAYFEGYRSGWDRAQEHCSAIWPTDSDGEPVLPTFPSSTPADSTKAMKGNQ